MLQDRFMEQLEQELMSVPEKEREEILVDYEEHFYIGREKGRSEEDIIKGLGSPKKVAKEILYNMKVSNANENPSFKNVSRAVLATLGLGFFNLVIVLAPYVLVLTVPFVLLTVGAVLVFSPVLLLIESGFTLTFLKEIFYMLGLVGVGLLALVGAYYTLRLIYKGTLRYLSFNLKVIRGS
ncbi:hypothetical protein AJ85_08350 [Alkalihalobacillus alcalophilus ATCC 27647 = CGMCC 1.3604]|uniref:DUF1700 domain-containing protein n=1 Tax=Alkalihalobacillus alcalophilus ATCC 27647 = CGMCC 1.3604 TaxID=1218173 RepID=A0A094XEJ8_ALKAL|nr:DUF1700 domain-containing protein [Alkalihalobacillus alcalophilus]KGA97190.1 hypothetical protein BALCAV_0211790 [Alkalihalobacillus alcalophilus ATCC 27647 = CGMCC 1.3604]MED1560878.1 DUF1700 domain-containing protein [Alkalihalobacillus alcalophilus]THG90864.1 hypothetical protein AJ85_08350 [Alkalihalobacillus alcalophilus ATCC 27647 = CGMCC 1.3604]